MIANIVLAAVFFLLTIGAGIWAGVPGAPHSPALFNAHRLIALAAAATAVDVRLLTAR